METENMANQSRINETAEAVSNAEAGAAGNEGGTRAATDAEASLETAERYPVRHNKETVALTLGELREAASKGLDYDRIRPSHDFVKTLAQRSGIPDVSRYIGTVQEELARDDAGTTPDGSGSLPDGPASREQEQLAVWTAIAEEFPDAVRGGRLNFPEGALRLLHDGTAPNPLEALRLNERAELKARLGAYEAGVAADKANLDGAAASAGDVAGGSAREKDFYTTDEWDRQPDDFKRRHILNGDFFKWAKKWH